MERGETRREPAGPWDGMGPECHVVGPEQANKNTRTCVCGSGCAHCWFWMLARALSFTRLLVRGETGIARGSWAGCPQPRLGDARGDRGSSLSLRAHRRVRQALCCVWYARGLIHPHGGAALSAEDTETHRTFLMCVGSGGREQPRLAPGPVQSGGRGRTSAHRTASHLSVFSLAVGTRFS